MQVKTSFILDFFFNLGDAGCSKQISKSTSEQKSCTSHEHGLYRHLCLDEYCHSKSAAAEVMYLP
jgi:hypothetical protein